LAHDRPKNRISAPRLAAFASPAFVGSALGLPVVAILPVLYGELGLGLAALGTIFMVTRFFDVFTDPLFGVIGDRIRSRFGRRRLAIALSVPILAYSVHRLFMPAETATQVGLIVSLLVLYVGWTMLTIAHTAWASELSADYDFRSRVMSTLQFFSLLGLVAVLLVPVLVDTVTPAADMRLRAEMMGWLILITLPVLSILALFSVPERARTAPASVSWRAGVKSIARNRALWRLLLADLLTSLAGGINGSLHYFYMEHVLDLLRAASLCQMVTFITGLCCVPLFLRLSYRLGKHRTLCWSALFSSFATALLFFIPTGAFWIALGVFVLVGVNFGAKWFLIYSMMADVIDQDTVNVGVERSALYYSMLTFTSKVGFALAVGITFSVLAWVGFDPKGVNDVTTLQGLRLVVAAFPTLITVVVAAIMWRFPIDKAAQRQTRAELTCCDSSGSRQRVRAPI
jgi:Na+/melibiose symporter-like transporter